MERNITQLMEVVERECEILEALSGALYQQKEAAIQGDVEELNKLTEIQRRAYVKIAKLEGERLQLVSPIAEELAVRPEEVTLSMLKERYQAEFNSRFEMMSNLLKRLTNRVKRTAKLNGMIIKRCLELGEERFKKMIDFHNRQDLYGFSAKKSKMGRNSGVIVNRQV